MVARLRIDLAFLAKPTRNVRDDKAKQVAQLFAAGELFSASLPDSIEAVR